MAWGAVRANCRSTSRPASSKNPQDTPAQSPMKFMMMGNGIITVERRQVVGPAGLTSAAFVIVAAGHQQPGRAEREGRGQRGLEELPSSEVHAHVVSLFAAVISDRAARSPARS